MCKSTFCTSLSDELPTKEALEAPKKFASMVSCCAFSVEGLDSDPEDESLLIDSISPGRMQINVLKLNTNLIYEKTTYSETKNGNHLMELCYLLAYCQQHS